MKIRTLVAILVALAAEVSSGRLSGQNPIAKGMNGQGLGDTTVWAAVSNPANTANLSNYMIGLGVKNNALIRDLNHYFLSAAVPVHRMTVTTDIQYHGYSIWQEHLLGAGCAQKIGERSSLAAKISFIHIGQGTEYSSINYFSPQLFYRTVATDYLRFYGQVSPAPWLYDQGYQSGQQDISIGAEYRFSSIFCGSADVSHALQTGIRVAVGAQYAVLQRVCLRMGIANDEQPIAMGVSAGKNNVWFDLACTYHRYLGVGCESGFRVAL